MRLRSVRRIAVAFLILECLGAVAWWLTLILVPATRSAFLGPRSPEVILLAFFAPDLVLFVGAALLAAMGIAKRSPWYWSVLCVHSGAAMYVAIYTLSLTLLTGNGGWGAWLMMPSLLVLPFLMWRLRPGLSQCRGVSDLPEC